MNWKKYLAQLTGVAIGALISLSWLSLKEAIASFFATGTIFLFANIIESPKNPKSERDKILSMFNWRTRRQVKDKYLSVGYALYGAREITIIYIADNKAVQDIYDKEHSPKSIIKPPF